MDRECASAGQGARRTPRNEASRQRPVAGATPLRAPAPPVATTPPGRLSSGADCPSLQPLGTRASPASLARLRSAQAAEIASPLPAFPRSAERRNLQAHASHPRATAWLRGTTPERPPKDCARSGRWGGSRPRPTPQAGPSKHRGAAPGSRARRAVRWCTRVEQERLRSPQRSLSGERQRPSGFCTEPVIPSTRRSQTSSQAAATLGRCTPCRTTAWPPAEA
mmetsp:Transcript_122679/g.342256  ORF Transcript_122679/g.342256 Transcript_122679/m.342256 type:complete len:222 (+) Transcript_122679:295-960(+)